MRRGILIFAIQAFLFFCMSDAFSQNASRETSRAHPYSDIVVKDIDGAMKDWPADNNSGTNYGVFLKINDRYQVDLQNPSFFAYDLTIPPEGGMGSNDDPPLGQNEDGSSMSKAMTFPYPGGFTELQPLPNNFNLWGLGLNWDPTGIDPGTGLGQGRIVVSFDLPANTYNGDPPVSPGWEEEGGKYFDLIGNQVDLKLQAFDIDSDGDFDIVDNLVFDTNVEDDVSEGYRIEIQIGGTQFAKAYYDSDFRKLKTGGLPIQFTIKAPTGNPDDGIILEALIQSQYLLAKSGDKIIPNDYFEWGGLYADNNPTTWNPASWINENHDIEFAIHDIYKLYEYVEALIDWSAIPGSTGPFERWELSRIYAWQKLLLEGDMPGETIIDLSAPDFPQLPLKATVDKTVSCGDCSGSTKPLSKHANALRQADLRFELDIQVPLLYEPGMPNGWGYIDINDDHHYIDKSGANHPVPGAEYELCEVIYTPYQSVQEAIACPDFNLAGVSARLQKETAPNVFEDIVFGPGDQVILVYAVYPNTTPGTEDFYTRYFTKDGEVDMEDTVFLTTTDPTGGNPEDSPPSSSDVDLLAPEFDCKKMVEFIDKNGKGYGPEEELDMDWWLGNADPTYYPEFPVTVTWHFFVGNWDEFTLLVTEDLVLDLDPISDPVLDALTGVTWNPPDKIPVPNPMLPGTPVTATVTATKTFTTYENWIADCGEDNDNNDSELTNEYSTTGHVDETHQLTARDLCLLRDGQIVPDYYLHCEDTSTLWLRSTFDVGVQKWVSCVNHTSPNNWTLKTVDSFRNTWVYYRILVKNYSSSGVHNLFIKDELLGHLTDWDQLSGPNEFDVNTPDYIKIPYNPPIPPGGEVEIIFKVLTDPNFNQKFTDGPMDDITNSVYILADGPDGDEDPDIEDNMANNSDNNIRINIKIPMLTINKEAWVEDDNGVIYDWAEQIVLDSSVVWPIDIKWRWELVNSGEVTIKGEVADDFLQKIEDGQFPPLFLEYSGNPVNPGPPDWSFDLGPGDSKEVVCTLKPLDTVAEAVATLLAANDETPNDDMVITNTVFTQNITLPPAICGTDDPNVDDSANILLSPKECVPALSEWGMILMVAILGGLMLFRMRNSA